MQFQLNIGKWYKFFLLIPLLSFFTYSALLAQVEKTEYLEKHFEYLNLEADTSPIPILDSVLPRYDLFLSGEWHHVSVNTKIQLRLLKYFYKNAGVRYYLWEAGYSFEYFMNKYLSN